MLANRRCFAHPMPMTFATLSHTDTHPNRGCTMHHTRLPAPRGARPSAAAVACRAALVLLAGAALAAARPARADEPFVYLTNWYAQAEHGGFYQAVATGIYKKYGLDVTVKMGGPQVNVLQLLAAGQADCIMGSSDLQIIQAREGGLPITTVMASFQKDPQVIIAHDDVKGWEDLKGKTILIGGGANRGYWPWLKARFGFTDEQTRPYTFNIQPFVADKNIAQQGYLTSEPYAVQKAGVKAKVLLISDTGYPAYAATVSCMDKTVKERSKAMAAFVKGTAEGWKSYLENPAPANALIKKDNPNMTDDQLAYSVSKLKEMGIVSSGDAQRLGIGVITDARAKASYDFLVSAKLIDPSKVELSKTYTTEFVKDTKVLP
jgi:NitT/TauT family transport system substrate-binding protein